MENLLGVIFFILFITLRAFFWGNKGGQRGGGQTPYPHRQKPPQQELPRGWWDELEDFEEPKSETPKTSKVEPDKPIIKREPIIEDKRDKINQVRPTLKEKTPAPEIYLDKSVTIEMDPEEIRKGFIWAEILQPPKAKRKRA